MFDIWPIFAAGGLLAGFLAYAKTLVWRLVNLFVVRIKLEGKSGEAFLFYCWRNMKRVPLGERRYRAFRPFVRPVKRFLVVGYEDVNADQMVFWQGWKPVIVSYFSGKQGTDPYDGTYVTFIRGMFEPDNLLSDAIDLFNKNSHDGCDNGSTSRFRVDRVAGPGSMRKMASIRMSGQDGSGQASTAPLEANEVYNPSWRLIKWHQQDIGAENPSDPWGAYAFPLEVEELIQEAKRWKESEEWYRSKKIPWRRGWLLYGPPGTGKTSLARAIAQELDLPVVVFDLVTFDNESFSSSWRNLMSKTPCMALLEDLDAVFKGRDNRLGEEGGGLSFDCLLNCLSGIESSDGVFTVVTTNRVEDLDEALGTPDAKTGVSTRPGRIDRAVQLGKLSEDCRRRLATRILSDCNWKIERVVSEGKGETGAQFQDRCAKIALDHFWRSEKT